MKKTVFNWSSGKDSAMALYKLQKSNQYNVQLLLTTISTPQERIQMHGIRKTLLLRQFQSLGLPYRIVEIPDGVDMAGYDSIMDREFKRLKDEGFEAGAFGDILLEDLRSYREARHRKFGLEAVFPLWQKPTAEVAADFLAQGFRAVVVSANAALFPSNFAGKLLDARFFDQLPAEVDFCGENGEFHTFCYAGPVFQMPVLFKKGAVVLEEYPAPAGVKSGLMENGKLGFWFRDLLTDE